MFNKESEGRDESVWLTAGGTPKWWALEKSDHFWYQFVKFLGGIFFLKGSNKHGKLANSSKERLLGGWAPRTVQGSGSVVNNNRKSPRPGVGCGTPSFYGRTWWHILWGDPHHLHGPGITQVGWSQSMSLHVWPWTPSHTSWGERCFIGRFWRSKYRTSVGVTRWPKVQKWWFFKNVPPFNYSYSFWVSMLDFGGGVFFEMGGFVVSPFLSPRG